MAALVQTLPQQSVSATMLQPRAPTGQSGQQYQQQPRTRTSGYRQAAAPIQPYAFTSTPAPGPAPQWQQHAPRPESTPSSTGSSFDSGSVGKTRHLTSASMSNLPQTATPGFGMGGSRDDSALVASAPRPQSTYVSGSPTQGSFKQATIAQPSKATPDRYRRTTPRIPDGSALPSGSGMAAVGHIYTAKPPVTIVRGRATSGGVSVRPNSFYAGSTSPGLAMADDMLACQQTSEQTKRFRRRSMHTLHSADYPTPLSTPQELFAQHQQAEQLSRSQSGPSQQRRPSSRPSTASAAAPSTGISTASDSLHSRHDSADSAHSNTSGKSNSASGNNSRPSSSQQQDIARAGNIPPRTSSTDVSKRAHHPSPLSKPVTMESDAAARSPTGPTTPTASVEPSPSKSTPVASPAVRQLASIRGMGKKPKNKPSRLRRAFSFGSAAELRAAAARGGDGENDGHPSQKSQHAKDGSSDAGLDEEQQARIAKKQEEGGMGYSIYGGRMFSSSSDNLSISSTASSASIMIRKMGQGMKRRSRSLIGLFRPKSVVGVPAEDGKTPEPGTATVSMVTAEAERGMAKREAGSEAANEMESPALKRPSLDPTDSPSRSSERVGSSGTDNSTSRKSIVGGERERAEVLAAVRKGILKRSGSNSPSPRPQDSNNFELPQIPAMADSPLSSAPSTPNSEMQGHKRSDSVAIGSEDYFITALRLRQDTRSAPNTPSGTTKRSATFSPRIVFHDTWHSQEYDRRGDVATCNRLTPVLAQQIKEELNNFKMEMEVHENSKIYTHFF